MTVDNTLAKGRFLFFPDGGDEAFEIDIEALLTKKKYSLCTRIKNFFSKKEEETAIMSLTKVKTTFVDVNELVCKKLEELLSTAQWYPKHTTTSPSFILHIYPGEEEEGWEPIVTITAPGGTALNLGLSDLLFHYDPEVGSTELSNIINN